MVDSSTMPYKNIYYKFLKINVVEILMIQFLSSSVITIGANDDHCKERHATNENF